MSSLRARIENTPTPALPVVELSQDPDKLLEQAAIAVAPVVEVVAPVEEIVPVVPVVEPPAPAPVVKRYEYRNHDEQGRPLGGVQVILYTDEEDLKKKWAAKEEQLVRRLREETRMRKLGISDDEVLPADAELAVFDAPKPRILSAEERFRLSQEINDPEKSVDAINQILEASVGYTAEQMRQQFDDARMAKLQHQAFVNYKVFEQSATDFFPTADNAKLLTDWMFSKRLAPTVKNYEIAFSSLQRAGLLEATPTVREVTPAPAPVPAPVVAPPAPASVSTEPKPVVPAVIESRIAPQDPPQQQRQPVRVPSGLNGRTSADGSGPTSVGISLTIAEFDAMPSDELKRKLKDPVFAKMVNEMYAPKKAQ